MTKLEFWGGGGSHKLGGVGRIRFGLGKENDKVGILGGEVGGEGGVTNLKLGLGLRRKMTKLILGGGWQNQIWTWEGKMTKLEFWGEGGVTNLKLGLGLGRKMTKLIFGGEVGRIRTWEGK